MRERSPGTSPKEVLRTLEALNARAEVRQEQARRRRRRARRGGLVGGILLVLGLVAVNVVVWGGYVRIPLVPSHRASPSPPSVTSRPAIATPPPSATGRSPSTLARTRPAVAPVRFRITAARGASWLMVRKSSPAGAVVYSGILSEGKSVTVEGTRFWLRFGAVGNLDLFLNGKAVRSAHAGTIDAVVTPGGLSS